MNLLSRFAFIVVAAGLVSSATAQVPRFVNPMSYSVPGASVAAVADVNGDRIPDIVTANGFVFTGSGVSILLGKGDGTFSPAQTIVAGGNPSYVVVGDFNHDGKPDIAVANQPDPNLSLIPATVGGPAHNSVSILLGNSDGTFQPSIDTPTLGALRIAAADFNGDGNLDLAVATGASSPVQILLGNGDGTFSVITTAVSSNSIFVGDFNHDGNVDLLAGGFELLGNGDDTFNTGPSLPGPLSESVVADFNGDGINDLVGIEIITGRNPAIMFGETFFGSTDGTWTQGPTTILTGLNNLVAADFDGDGKLDAFAPGQAMLSPANQQIGGLFLGNGDGTFTRASAGFGFPGYTSSGSPFPAFAAVGDLDGNGSPDVVIANGSGVAVSLNTFGHPPLLAQFTTSTNAIVGNTGTITGTLALGAPAPNGGTLVTLASSDPAVFFPNGNTVSISAGAQSVAFPMLTSSVHAAVTVTLSASSGAVTQTSTLNVVPPFSLVSVSVAPSSLFGMFGGTSATGTVTLSGPASDGVVIALTSSAPGILSSPATVSIPPGAQTATFPVKAGFVTADTQATISAAFQGVTVTSRTTIHKETASIVVTKAEYTVKRSQLNIEATSTDRVASLQIYNPTTGTLVGTIPLVNVGKFVGQITVPGPFTSAAVQSGVGGLSIVPVVQK